MTLERQMNLPQINVAVGVLMNEAREILIARRPDGKPMPGSWEFPGGKIEAQETASQALLREMREELGIRIDLDHTTLLGKVEYAYPEFIFHAPVFLCVHWQEEPQPLEGQRLAWIRLQDFPSYHFLPACEKIFSLIEQKTDLF
jgi:8-oxo-dGTP diphosphatase